ncbi:hypothetical protein B0H13DRAFT_1869536 [Mycena leptocephala]|nr:hypothetical protein B0H13DRAFT_1869536 [Mycena leptocephala]
MQPVPLDPRQSVPSSPSHLPAPEEPSRSYFAHHNNAPATYYCVIEYHVSPLAMGVFPCVTAADGIRTDDPEGNSMTSFSCFSQRRDATHAEVEQVIVLFGDYVRPKVPGRVMLERMQKYVPQMLETRAAWVDMEASFLLAVIEEWMAMAVAWEKDAEAPNLFASKINHVGLKAVRRKLAVITSEDVEHLRVCGDMHNTENGPEARGGAVRKNWPHMSRMTTIERETKLRRKIDAWMTVQQLFIPEVALLQEREDAAQKHVDMKLWLPLAIRTRTQCDLGLLEYEYELRKGQVFVALDEIRDQLLVHTHEYKYKDKSLHGNKAKTRSATRTKAIDVRIERASEEYRTAYAALVSLGATLRETEWQQHLKVLKPGDVRDQPSSLFGDEERQKGGGRQKKQMDPEEAARWATLQAEGKMAMSWIWLSQGTDGKEEDVVHNKALCIEWAKTRARSMHYTEKVDLGEEEMRCVPDFLNRCREWWRSRVGLRAALQPEEALREGHSTYAHKQAEIMEGLSALFRQQWADVERFLELAHAEYAHTRHQVQRGFIAIFIHIPFFALTWCFLCWAATSNKKTQRREGVGVRIGVLAKAQLQMGTMY